MRIFFISFLLCCFGNVCADDVDVICNTKNINKMEVIYYPTFILNNIATTKEQLKLRYIYKFEINNIQDTPYQEEIMRILRIDYSEKKKDSDIRWGVNISSEGGGRCSLYFDAFGKCGKINDVDVCFKNNKIIDWVKNNIPIFMQYDNDVQ